MSILCTWFLIMRPLLNQTPASLQSTLLSLPGSSNLNLWFPSSIHYRWSKAWQTLALRVFRVFERFTIIIIISYTDAEVSAPLPLKGAKVSLRHSRLVRARRTESLTSANSRHEHTNSLLRTAALIIVSDANNNYSFTLYFFFILKSSSQPAVSANQRLKRG